MLTICAASGSMRGALRGSAGAGSRGAADGGPDAPNPAGADTTRSRTTRSVRKRGSRPSAAPTLISNTSPAASGGGVQPSTSQPFRSRRNVALSGRPAVKNTGSSPSASRTRTCSCQCRPATSRCGPIRPSSGGAFPRRVAISPDRVTSPGTTPSSVPSLPPSEPADGRLGMLPPAPSRLWRAPGSAFSSGSRSGGTFDRSPGRRSTAIRPPSVGTGSGTAARA